MARKRCQACQQFYGPASVHRCPSLTTAAAPSLANNGLPTSALASPQNQNVVPYQGFFARGEAREYAFRVESAMRIPVDSQDARNLSEERALVEARFGSIDWSA